MSSENGAIMDKVTIGLICTISGIVVILVGVVMYLWSRERRFFLKAVLHRYGMWRTEVMENYLPFDAFVTYSKEDQGVAREISSRLEPPYRLCLHDRNWGPGLMIEDLIDESVHVSHRTIALVSKQFLERWHACEAYKSAVLRGRMILVLLEDPTVLNDVRLQSYLDSYTWLRWGEPWFYNKLAVALPRPRRPSGVSEGAPIITSTAHSRAISSWERKISSKLPITPIKIHKPMVLDKGMATQVFTGKHFA